MVGAETTVREGKSEKWEERREEEVEKTTVRKGKTRKERDLYGEG